MPQHLATLLAQPSTTPSPQKSVDQLNPTDQLNQVFHLILPVLMPALAIAVLLIAWQAYKAYMDYWDRKNADQYSITRPATPPQPTPAPRPAPTRSRETVWAHAQRIKSEVHAAHTKWEFDLEDRLFKRPLLGDVTEPKTIAWLEALETMELTFPDKQPPSIEACQRALDTALTAQQAWRTAAAHARGVGLHQLPTAQRRNLQRAHKLITQALDPGVSDSERATYIDKAVDLLAAATSRPARDVREEVTAAVTRRLAELETSTRRELSPPA